MARFESFDMGQGWWFYIEMRLAGSPEEFKVEFIQEISHLLDHEGSKVIYSVKDGKVKEGVSMQRVRS